MSYKPEFEIYKVIQDQLDKEIEVGNPYRASSSGSCARKLAYQKLGIKPAPLGWRNHLVFELGHAIESQMQPYCKKAFKTYVGNDNDQECVSITLDDGTVLSGHLDGVMNEYDKPTGDLMIVDWKSCATEKFKYQIEKADKDPYTKLGIGYVNQAHCYMKAKNAKKACYIFYNKNISAMRSVTIDWDDMYWDDINDRYAKVKACDSLDTLPEQEYHPAQRQYGFMCTYCAYCETICYPEYEIYNDPKTQKIRSRLRCED